jgi:hypothetical protein
MRPKTFGMSHQPSPIDQRRIELGRGSVAVRAEKWQHPVGLLKRMNASHKIDDRLGRKHGDSGASDMLDAGILPRTDCLQTAFLLIKKLRPCRIIGNNPHRFINRPLQRFRLQHPQSLSVSGKKVKLGHSPAPYLDATISHFVLSYLSFDSTRHNLDQPEARSPHIQNPTGLPKNLRLSATFVACG